MNKISNSDNLQNEEIDFQFLINLILRNKLLIGFITLITFVLITLYSFAKKKIWEGEFQIVLAKNSNKNSLGQFSQLASASNLLRLVDIDLGSGAGNASLETEVGILESPSVLMPIFEYVKDSKENTSKNSDFNFSKWKKDNLDIKLLKKTSILNISYRDNDEDLIIPVLEKISKAYQIYSGKNKKRNLNLTKQYLNEQRELYKTKSSLSLRKLQEYAIDKDLVMESSYFNIFENNSSDSTQKNPINDQYYMNNAGIGYLRVKAANKIKKINFLLEKITDSKNDVNNLEYLAQSIPSLSDSGISKTIDALNKRLVAARSIFTENDPNVKILLEEKKELIISLEEKILGLLNAEKIEWESILESTNRPKEVLLEYKKLSRDAFTDEKTLIELDKQLRILNLQEAKIEDPWELISKPTLNLKPVSPRKKNYAIAGLLLGFLLGIIYVMYKEKKSDLIFEKRILEEITETKILEEINIVEKILKNYSPDILLNEIIGINSIDSIKIINKLNMDNNDFLQEFSFIFKDKKFSFDDSFVNNENEEILLLITKLGEITFGEIYALNNRLNILNKKIFGIILVN